MATTKTTNKKTAVKKPAKVSKKVVASKPATKAKSEMKEKQAGFEVATISVAGNASTAKIDIAQVKYPTSLLTQAIRVYQSRQHQGTRSTKTRGEVSGSTRKLFKQKGTGRARHGSIKAPIFVGGGIALGPKPHDPALSISRSMQQKTFAAVLSNTITEKKFTLITGADKFSGKTKEMAQLLKKMNLQTRKVLFVIDPQETLVRRSVDNLEKACSVFASMLSFYDLLSHDAVLITENALKIVQKRLPQTV